MRTFVAFWRRGVKQQRCFSGFPQTPKQMTKFNGHLELIFAFTPVEWSMFNLTKTKSSSITLFACDSTAFSFQLHYLVVLMISPFRIQKNKTPNSSPNTTGNRYLKFFHCYTQQELEISLQISSYLKSVATLPCKRSVFKNCIDQKHSNGRPGVRIPNRT